MTDNRKWMGFSAVAVLAASAALAQAAAAHKPAHRTAPPKPSAPAAIDADNPLLPPQVPVDSLMPELTVIQKLPMIAPAGWDPLYSAADWDAYRQSFGAQADDIVRKRSSGMIEFAKQLISAGHTETAARPGLARLLFLRAATICYRNRDGFPTANSAVEAYQIAMDIHDPLQVAGLWTITNQMAKMAVTPKPERIRYSGIAARANMQLALLLLDRDQVQPAEALIRQIGYHEGWLKGDPHTRSQIAQVRAQVKQTAGLLATLGAQYQPAVKGDDSALMAIYLYGRYVKGRPELVADLPGRKPGSAMAQLDRSLAAADKDPAAAFDAAELLRNVADSLPPGVLKQRTLYAALGYYRAYMKDPATEHERIKRTLARMAIAAVIGDGARGPHSIEPFATPATQPAPTTQPAPPETPIAQG